MADTPVPSQLTAEFGHDIEAERQQLLRRRFLWYTGTVSVISLLGVIATVVAGGASASQVLSGLTIALAGVGFTLYSASFFYIWFVRDTRWPLIRICLWLIVVSGMLNLLGGPLAIGQMEKTITLMKARQAAMKKPAAPPAIEVPAPAAEQSPLPGGDADVGAEKKPRRLHVRSPSGLVEADIDEPPDGISGAGWLTTFSAIGAGLGGAFSIFGRHFLACLFLPLTPRECIRPLIPLLILNAGLIAIYVTRALISGASTWVLFGGLGVIAISPLIGLPGYGLIYWRDSKFREGVVNRMMRGRYVEMHRELVDARRIHESLFPCPITDGPITMGFAYEPMRQIGGDYLFAKHTLGPAGNPRLNIVILDVTGHGIPAALTVNRLHGELERIFAEQPNTNPGELLRLLNRYVNLTLAGHAVYVTGLCVRVDDAAHTLEYASGGHPPAFLYAANGTLHEFQSTAMILGAVTDAEFDSAMQTHKFMPGDRLIAYTDGAFECRDRTGAQLRIAGIRSLISRGPDQAAPWPNSILKSVETFRFGLPQDDTLVVELAYSLNPVPRGTSMRSGRTGIYSAIKSSS